MLDIKYIRENPGKVKEAMASRGLEVDVSNLLRVDEQRREVLHKVEDLRAKQNALSKGVAKSSAQERAAKIQKGKELKEELAHVEEQLAELDGHLDILMRQLANIPQEGIPSGGEENNKVLRQVGKKPTFPFEPKDHLELGEALNIIDVKRAAKLSGTRFAYLKREAALMEFALVQLAFDVALKEGFVPVVPPVLVKPEAMQGMGYVDTPEDLAERYYLEKDQLFLVGTAEQAIGPLHQGEVFEAAELPSRAIAFSTCFREEAGSYGKDTRGILRLHQFDKVEMFSFAHPDKSKEEHEFLLSLQERLLQQLKIPYRVVQLAAGDMARPASTTIDIEAWLPGQGRYREVSSASNTTDFQARRLNIRFQEKGGKPEYAHMLNATAFAIGRTLIAILENYQQKDGSVKIPVVLQKYIGKRKI